MSICLCKYNSSSNLYSSSRFIRLLNISSNFSYTKGVGLKPFRLLMVIGSNLQYIALRDRASSYTHTSPMLRVRACRT